MVRTRNGTFIPAGGLWEKMAANGTGAFLQGQIDDPSFEAPLSIALFTQQDGALNVVWSRPRRRMTNPFDEGAPTSADGDTAFSPRSDLRRPQRRSLCLCDGRLRRRRSLNPQASPTNLAVRPPPRSDRIFCRRGQRHARRLPVRSAVLAPLPTNGRPMAPTNAVLTVSHQRRLR
jgi:hypothetical protein